ncbi:ZIP family zinc transporter [Flammeovirgaceae bacterium 311]|nr:ZIP family zinc transporter [Flammeovirgaceae bacterium 311]
MSIPDWFRELSPVLQALLATLFTWAVTALGASLVFFFNRVAHRVMNLMLGFAAGVMIAASYWSLLAPAIRLSEQNGDTASWFPAAVGFMAGGLFVGLINKVLPHLHPGLEKEEGPQSSLRRSILLVLAITLHNIPEGLAVGVAFGAAAGNFEGATIGGAIALAIGIGLQNFPEGTSVAVPLRREGYTRRRAFWYGQLSGAVEPIAGVLGAWMVIAIQPILPYSLAFAAGAMIYVVVEELIPSAQMEKDKNLATLGALCGFTLMMILDVALG